MSPQAQIRVQCSCGAGGRTKAHHDACGLAVFDMIEFLGAKSGVSAWLQERSVPLWIPRLVYRSLYVVLMTFIAIVLPFFGGKLF